MPKDNEASDDKKDMKYELIPPFVDVSIKWDEKDKEFRYLVSEPKLTKEEEKTKEKIVNGLLEMLDIELSSIKKKGDALEYLREQVKKILDEYDIKLPEDKLSKILYFIHRDFVGLNEIEPMMQDPNIEDISCDGVGIPLFIIHRKFGSIKSNIVYDDEKRLKDFVVKLAERCTVFNIQGSIS